MQFTTPAISTLYVNVRLRKSPYANKLVALRITANFYRDFTFRDAKFMREVTYKCKLEQLRVVVAQLQKEANAATVSVNIPANVLKLLEANSK